MPILKNAQKALRVSERKTVVNRRVKSQLKTAVDGYRQKPDTDLLSSAFSKIDKAVKRHLLHRNTAARLKSQLSKQLPA